MDRTSVAKLIESAWAAEPLPTRIADDETGYHLECLAVAHFFRGKTWKEITWPILTTYKGDRSACLCFMSPEAFRYFLCSYMLIAINNYAEADVSGDSAWRSLESREERLFGLTPKQHAAIRAFVAYMSHTHRSESPYTEGQVLSQWGVAP
jgi:hypothetical protein